LRGAGTTSWRAGGGAVLKKISTAANVGIESDTLPSDAAIRTANNGLRNFMMLCLHEVDRGRCTSLYVLGIDYFAEGENAAFKLQ
jgi:hypothetical protein